MPRVPVRDIGKVGINTDLPPHELPPEVWSRGRNIHAQNGYIYPVKGEQVFWRENEIITAPYQIFPSPNAANKFWLYAGVDKVGSVQDGLHTDVTPTPAPAGSLGRKWTGGWLNGVFALNNPLSSLMVWYPIAGSTPLEYVHTLAGSNYEQDWRFNSIRPFKNMLLGMDFTDENSQRFPTVVKWSHPADPGYPPVDWDETDVTNLAGSHALSETPGAVVDGLALRDSFMIYKEDATAVAHLGGIGGLSFEFISLNSGMMAAGCAVEFIKGQHCVLTQNADVIVTNGLELYSILDRRMREYLQRTISGDMLKLSFLSMNPLTMQIWICYCTGATERPNEAIVWNYESNTLTIRDLGQLSDISYGKIDDVSQEVRIDDMNWPIDSWQAPIDGGGLRGQYAQIAAGENGLWRIEEGFGIGGTGMSSYVERTGLAIVGINRDQSIRVDPTKVKLVTEVWPIIECNESIVFVVQVGAQEDRNGPVVWDEPQPFNPKTDTKVDCFIEGAYIAIRISVNTALPWRLHGYSLQVDIVGDYL